MAAPHIISERPARSVKRPTVDNPMGYCDGWAFGVALPAFFDALDITFRERQYEVTYSDGAIEKEFRQEWCTSSPPAYSFEAGDTFHCPHPAPGPWGEQIKEIDHSIQIIATSADKKEVTITAIHRRSGQRETVTVTQADLVHILQYGWAK